MSATDVTETALKLVEDSLAEKEAKLTELAGPLGEEISAHKAFIKKNRKGSGTTSATPAVADEDLLEAVGHVSKSGPATTKEIAKFLGVDARKIAKKLSKHANDGTISGNKDEGYTV